MPHEPDVWTGDARRLLYSLLVKKFGPLSAWQSANSPGQGRDDEYRQFLEDFARTVGASSGNAVQMQIRFAMPETENGSTWVAGHVQAAILNKAAALEAGFIESRHLPEQMAVVGRAA